MRVMGNFRVHFSHVSNAPCVSVYNSLLHSPNLILLTFPYALSQVWWGTASASTLNAGTQGLCFTSVLREALD